MENEFFCGGNCPGCEKFAKKTPTLTESEVGVPTSPKESVGKERSKEGKDKEKLDKLIKELEKKNKKEQEKYKKKK